MRSPRRVLILLNSTMRPFYRQVIQGIVEFNTCQEGLPWELSIPNYFQFIRPYSYQDIGRYDGVITGVQDEALQEQLAENGIACSYVGPYWRAPSDLAYIDVSRIADLAVKQLRKFGAQSLAYVGLGGTNDPWENEQRQSFCELGATAQCFKWAHTYDRRKFAAELDKLAAWMQGLPPRTGILASNDEYAGRVVDAGYRVECKPSQDYSIIGVGNDPVFCERIHPSLTSVELGLQEMGWLAANSLAHRFLHPKAKPRVQIISRPLLVKRLSDGLRSDEHSLVERAMRQLRADLPGIRSSLALAAEVGVSSQTLTRHFLQAFDMTPAQMIRQTRLQEARRLLTTTRRTLVEIADAAGFADQAHMTKVLRSQLGKTPGQISREAGRFSFSSH